MTHQVDFYCFSAVNIYDWAEVIRLLRGRGIDARYVILPPEKNPANPVIDGMRQSSVDHETFETLTRLALAEGLVPLFEARYETATVVTNADRHLIAGYTGKKVRMQYGASVITDSYTQGAVNEGFDLVLAHGEHSATMMRQWGSPVEVVGFPKYAEFEKVKNEAEVWKAKWGLDPVKKTVAYCSTWASHSSLDRFADAIIDLAREYNVIYKPHAYARRFESSRYEALRRANVVVDEETQSLLPFLAVADIAVADDRSGSFTEPMLVGLPVVGLSATGDLNRDRLLPGVEDVAAICTDPASLRDVVDIELMNDGRASARTELVSRLFSGVDARPAADAIAALAQERSIASGIPVESGAVTVVVRAGTNDLDLLRTLDSLRGQTSLGSFDVAVVDVPDKARFGCALDSSEWPYPIDVWEHGVGTSAINDVISDAAGRLVILLAAGISASPNLVAAHLEAHDRASERSVVRGGVDFGETVLSVLTQAWARVAGGALGDWHVSANNVSFRRGLFAYESIFDDRVVSTLGRTLDFFDRARSRAIPVLDCPEAAGVDVRQPTVRSLREYVCAIGRGYVELLAKNPAAPRLALPAESVESLQASLVADVELQSQLMHVLHDIGGARTAYMDSVGAGNVAGAMLAVVEQALSRLIPIWLGHGTLEGLREIREESVDQLRIAGIELMAASAPYRALAFPNYADPAQLDALMGFAKAHLCGHSAVLCLPARQGDTEVERALHAAFERNIGDGIELDVCFVSPTDNERLRRRATHIVTLG